MNPTDTSNDAGQGLNTAPAPNPAPSGLSPVQAPEPAVSAPISTPAPVAPTPVAPEPVANPAPVGQTVAVPREKSGKGFIVAIVAVVVFAAVGAGVFFLGKNIGSNSNLSKRAQYAFDKNNPIPFEDKSGKYGYVTLSGKVIIEPKFDSAEMFQGDYAVVGMDSTDSYGTDWYVINRKGEFVSGKNNNSSDIMHDRTFDIWYADDTVYDKNFKRLLPEDQKVTSSEEGGLIETRRDEENGDAYFYLYNYKGELLGEGERREVVYFAYGPKISYAFDGVFKHEYCGIHREKDYFQEDDNAIARCDTGQIVVDYQDGEIMSLGDNIFRRLVCENSYNCDYHYVYIQDDSIKYEFVAETGYSTMKFVSKDILYMTDDDKKAYYDLTAGKEINEQEFIEKRRKNISDSQYVLNDAKGAYESCGDDKFQLYTLKGKKVGDCEWDDVSYFVMPSSQYLYTKGKFFIFAKKGEECYLYNLVNGKSEKLPADPDVNYVFIQYKDPDSKKLVVRNLATDKSAEFSENAKVKETKGTYIIVIDNGKEMYFDENMKEFFEA